MTTQLAVFNLYGIAIASDTLASLRTQSGFKYSFGNSKIWEPGGDHKFVVYHSGAALFNSMPHQIHIESWFRTLTKPLRTLDAYAQSYKKFCVSKASTHSPASEPVLLKSLFSELSTMMHNYALEEAKPENKEEWNAALIEQATQALKYYTDLDNFPKTSITWAEETITNSKFNVRKELKEVFPEGFPPKFYNTFVKVFKKFLISACITENDSTLTFAGYGADDLYVSTRKLNFRGILNGRVLFKTINEQSLDAVTNFRGLLYGAQNDAMWGFVQGFRSPVRGHLSSILDNHLPDGDGKQAKIDQVLEDLNAATDQDYVSPFFRRLSSCSVKELAETARDMINLQLLSAKLSGTQETVGGEVELLTIDKVNGIQWLNRI